MVDVVSAQEMAALFPDRVIAIRGGIDNISQAESAISAKLAECIEHEMQQGLGMVSVLAWPLSRVVRMNVNHASVDLFYHLMQCFAHGKKAVTAICDYLLAELF